MTTATRSSTPAPARSTTRRPTRTSPQSGGTSLAIGSSNNYEWEQGWGTGKSVLTNGAWDPLKPAYIYGGGGGTSALFAEPWYQKGVVPTSISN